MTLFVLNLTPIPREHYPLGPPLSGYRLEYFNSDAQLCGANGHGNIVGSLSLTLPPPGTLCLRHSRDAEP
jgi:1,4-alpha-glucan branching enzyme